MTTATEEHRHRCEVRYVLAMPEDAAKVYMREVGKRRGRAAFANLLRDVKRQHAAGNTGTWGDWKA